MTPRLRPLVLLLAAVLGLAGCRRDRTLTEGAFDPDRVPDAFRRPLGVLMWPGATRAFMVTPEGDLENGAFRLHLAPTAAGVVASPPRRIASEERWLPVLHWNRDDGPVRWEFEAVAAPAPEPDLFGSSGRLAMTVGRWSQSEQRRKVDAALAARPLAELDRLLLRARRPTEANDFDRAGLVVSLEVRARNLAAHPVRVAIDASLRGTPPDAGFTAPDASVADSTGRLWAAGPAGPAVAWADGGAPIAILAPGASRTFRIVLSAYPQPAACLAAWAAVPHAERTDAARAWWRREVDRGTRFSLHDATVEDAVRGARVVLLALRERRGEGWAPIGGPFHYRDIWLRDGARAMQALALSGYLDEARAMTPTVLSFQWPNGPFVSQTAQLDGTGQALWVLDQVLLRGRPPRDLARDADAAWRAWRWYERRRADVPEPGDRAELLPRTDPHDAELVRAQLVGNDAWALAGYRAAARLLRAAGRERDAREVEQSRIGYQRAFDRALAACATPEIPPAWTPGGLDWGNLAVAWPCGAVAADDPRAAATASGYWKRARGFPLGFYGNADSTLHGYVGADLGTWALLAGRRDAADRVLDALLEWRDACGGACETWTPATHDFRANFPPHPTSAAALLTLLRNALIEDDGERLRLTLGARDAWWRAGSQVERAPTRWGTIDLAFRSDGRTAEWTWTPVPVWTELTLPPHTGRAALSAPLRAGSRPDLVLCPPGVGHAVVRLVPGSAPGALALR